MKRYLFDLKYQFDTQLHYTIILLDYVACRKEGKHVNVIKYIAPLKVETQNLFWTVISNPLLSYFCIKITDL